MAPCHRTSRLTQEVFTKSATPTSTRHRGFNQEIPDTLLPSQVYLASAANPERALWAAVLYGAVNEAAGKTTYSSGDERRQTRDQFRMDRETDARTWIADTEAEGVGSFPWVCTQLGIEPTYLRHRLQTQSHRVKWTKRFAGCRHSIRPKKSRSLDAAKANG